MATIDANADRLNRIAKSLNSRENAISSQRNVIDELSNSMCEAATQLMEAQDAARYFETDLEGRNRKISMLEERIAGLEDCIKDKNEELLDKTTELGSLKKEIQRILRQNEVMSSDFDSVSSELSVLRSHFAELERMKNRSDLIQVNLVNELESLPVINKRLESDCAFLREDLKSCAAKVSNLTKENEYLSTRLKTIDSILTTEQRVRVNEKLGAPVRPSSEVGAASELRRLQIETMELRMRLVDSQAARDKAQSQLIDQSQMIAKLQKELGSSGNIEQQENIGPRMSPPLEVKRPKTSQNPSLREKASAARLSTGVQQECKQQ
jgi:DNA repair exonuclease SbcCD ATPase subunit